MFNQILKAMAEKGKNTTKDDSQGPKKTGAKKKAPAKKPAAISKPGADIQPR